MTTNVNALVARLKGLGITLAAKDGNLLLADPRKQLTAELRDAIRAAKPELLAALSKREGSGERALADVPRAGRRPSYPASSQQRRLYALQQLEPDSVAYNITSAYRLSGAFEVARIQAAIAQVIERHDSLRASFDIAGDKLVMRVSDKVDFELEVEDAPRAELEARIGAFARAFDLGQAPLLRAKAFRLEDGETVLVTDMHHAISDGISAALLVRDFARAFAGAPLPAPALQYGDYSVWQQEGAGRPLIARQARFWQAQFADEIEPLALPTDFPRPRDRSFVGASLAATWDPALLSSLRGFCRERDVTQFVALYALYCAALARLSGQEDVAVGTAVAGREAAGLADTIGMFANTLALRARPAGGKRFVDFLAEAKETCLGAFENQQYPFEELLEALDLERDASRNPLFDAFLVLQNFEGEAAVQGMGGLGPYALERRTAKFDLSLSVAEADGSLRLEFEYATALYSESTIRRIAARLELFARGVFASPESLIREIPILLPGEREQLLQGFNGTARPYPRDRSIHSFFEEQAARTPEAPALYWEKDTLSYREVDARANRLARLLAESHGIGRGDIVALAVERSFEMVLAILATLKAGAAYLPIDPRVPQARLDYILADSGAKLLLTQGRLGIAPSGAVAARDLEEGAWQTEGDASPLGRAVGGSDLLYVVYTSGSTGKPKGVLIEHRVATNALLETERMYPLGEDGRYLLKTTYSFDVSISELFGWFLGGGALAILPPEQEKDPEAIAAAIDAFAVTHVNFVPSMLSVLLDTLDASRLASLRRLRRIILAGEAVPPALLEKLAKVRGDARVENVYGPSETFYTTYEPLSDWRPGEKVLIGRPFANVRIFVLGSGGELLPIGAPGEICVSGDSLARGYLALEELTRERFAPNPYEPGERMYRTGDLGRWRSDGALEYFGRMDGQVKIRGNRVELGEIESAILAADRGVREAVVVARPLQGELTLVAYCQVAGELDAGALRAAIKSELPGYMVPSFFVPLASFPTTSSGKIDRKALPSPDGAQAVGAEYVAPRDDMERDVAALWQEILGVAKVGVTEEFFDVGGHSLKAVLLMKRIETQFNVTVPLLTVMNSTVASLAATIAASQPKKAPPARRGLGRSLAGMVGLDKSD